MLHGFRLAEERPDVFGEVRSDGEDEQGGDADPVFDEGGVHADVGGDFAVPVTGRLEFVEGVLQGILVVGAVSWVSFEHSCNDRKVRTSHSDPW